MEKQKKNYEEKSLNTSQDKAKLSVRAQNSTPTLEEYQAIQLAYNYFNETLFDSKLPECIIIFNRSRRASGTFWAETWKKGDEIQHEISLNPDHLHRESEKVLGTLAHEMVHLKQYLYGKPSTGNYHNLEFSRMMLQVGLITSKTGKEGGARIGRGMSHYIKEGGVFEQALKNMPKDCFLPWINARHKRINPASKIKKAVSKGKLKYTCSSCRAKVWGKQGLSINCGKCHFQMLSETADILIIKEHQNFKK